MARNSHVSGQKWDLRNEAIDSFNFDIGRLCQGLGRKRHHLAKKMGVMAESLSRSLSGQPRINSLGEFQRIVANRPKIEFTMDSELEEDDGGLPF